MRQDLCETLYERYPKIFSTGCGVACGDGWFVLIDMLCARLQSDIDLNGSPQIVVEKIKEKFGGLRFYASGCNDFQRGMIEFADAISMTLCDDCGNAGKRITERGVVMTRCPAHTPTEI